ncbi:hypothetical protein D3C87_76580 [compost metagenome]
MNIYCEDDYCPICNSKILVKIKNGIMLKQCKNECYKIAYYIDNIDYFGVKVFKESFSNLGNKNSKYLIENIEKKIKYLKEDNRYITEILLFNGSDEFV